MPHHKHTLFFNEVYYDQVDGCSMGSPLAPALANLFMGHNENKWLHNNSVKIPVFYKRYVDDILAIFQNDTDATEFLNYLNNQHTNISFTLEKESNKKLAFLDTLLDKNNDFKISVYHKKNVTLGY